MIIDVDDIKSGILSIDEQDNISQSISGKWNLHFLGSSPTNTLYQLYFLTQLEDREIYYNTMKIPWLKEKKYSKYHTRIEIDLNTIPQNYQLIDVFGTISDSTVEEIILNFENKTNAFGYRQENFNGNQTFLLGTLARIDEQNWKFYPIFKEFEMNIAAIRWGYIHGCFDELY